MELGRGSYKAGLMEREAVIKSIWAILNNPVQMLRTMGNDPKRSAFRKGCSGCSRNGWKGKRGRKTSEDLTEVSGSRNDGNWVFLKDI